MSPEQFWCLLKLVGATIKKNSTSFCECISDEERLVLTGWFLASGDAQQSIASSFRIGKGTFTNIRETCNATYGSRQDIHFKTKNRKTGWEKQCNLKRKWNIPNVIGTMDGKHIRMECPKLTGP